MKIYLAGPDVFLPDAAAMAAEKKRLCAAHGFEGVFPTDPRPGAPAEGWFAIYLHNEAHIRDCDAMIANLTPFRGVSADPGTVYEVGFMRALGRPVLGYSNDATDFSVRTLAALGAAAGSDAAGDRTDADGLWIENHGLADNLMIDGGIRAAGGVLVRSAVPAERRWSDLAGFEACLRALGASLPALAGEGWGGGSRSQYRRQPYRLASRHGTNLEHPTGAPAMTTGRPTIAGARHAISAGHYLAASAGFAILEAGGNAIDAGCAAGLALGVLQPDLVSCAGVAPILLRMADGTVESIAGLGHWPRATPPDVFMREHGGKLPVGVRRMVVPAAPDAWITALERHGTMSFGDIAAAAIRFAGEGFAMYPLLRGTLAAHEADYRRWPQNAAIFLPGGDVPVLGQLFRQTDLAASLTYMVDQERAAAGQGRIAGLMAAHAAFYKGDLAKTVIDFIQTEGGFLSRQDLAEFRSRIEPHVARRWRGHEVLTCGPWCQGPALIEALLIAEKLGLDGLAHNSAQYIHTITEALKGALADREYHFTDPAFGDVPLETLLSPAHIAKRAAAVDPDRACPEMPGPILGNGVELPPATREKLPMVDADTSYVAVVDRWGNAFSATPSDGSWNIPVVPGTGLVISGRGSQNRPDPAHPAGVAPGKRPRLTPNPAMVVTKDGGVMPFGTPGGDVQIQAMLQVMLNIFLFDMEVQDAIEAPRFASYSFPSSFAPYEYFPGRLALESRIPQETRTALAGMGHEVKDWPDWTWLAGSVEVVLDDPASGLKRAGADPRRPAYAIAI